MIETTFGVIAVLAITMSLVMATRTYFTERRAKDAERYIQVLEDSLDAARSRVPICLPPASFLSRRDGVYVTVCARYISENGKESIVLPIKRFPIDGDPDFAELEAGELIENINE